MTSSRVSRLYVYAVRSWLTSRAPLRDSWNIVKRMMRIRALDADLREEQALEVPEERQLAFVGRDVADRALQREHALRPLERIEPQAPVDDLQQIVRILARPDLLGRNQVIFRQPRIRRLRRKGREAREHGRAGAVDVSPGAEAIVIAILFRRGEPRRVHRRELRPVAGKRL